MTRMTRFVTACALTCVLTGAAIAACGGRSGPGELPPMAPRPGKGDPTAMPLPRGVRPTASASAATIPVPEFAPVVGEALDAGTGDGYSPPLPPLLDGGLPADSRLEPRHAE